MNKSRAALIDTRTLLPAVLGALASILFVALVTWAATTINNNVNTGGTLTVSGDSTLTGTTTSAGGIYASSTVFSDGIFTNTRNAVLGGASGTPTVTGLNVTGSGYLTAGLGVGKATTGAGNLLVDELAVIEGRLGVNASTSPTVELGVIGSGYFSSGLGVGNATSSDGNLLVNNLAVFRGRLGVSSTSPTVDFGVVGSGYLSGGLGVGNATSSNGNLLVNDLAVFRGRVGVSTTSPTVDFGVVGSGYVTGGFGVGIATTSNGGLSVSGMSTFNSAIDVRSGTSTITGAAVGLMGSSTPYLEVGIAGDVAIGGALGTSTLSVETTTASRGACIELKDAAGRWIRLYAGSVGTTTGSIGVVPAGGSGLIVESGVRCQPGNE